MATRRVLNFDVVIAVNAIVAKPVFLAMYDAM